MIADDDVEEIPFDDNEVPALPEREIQPPRVNTFFDNDTAAADKSVATVSGVTTH